MQGTNDWDSWETTQQPQTVFNFGVNKQFRYTMGSIRLAKIERGASTYIGWVLCYPDGQPITYADNNQPGTIKVTATGTYMTN